MWPAIYCSYTFFRVIFYFWHYFNYHCTNIVAFSDCGKPDIPKVTKIGRWSVSISITPPAGADTSKVIMYHTIYRKVGDTEWQSVPETSSTSVTVSHLYSYTHYEITVAAKYQGGEFGPASDPLKVKTKCGKCSFGVLPFRPIPFRPMG